MIACPERVVGVRETEKVCCTISYYVSCDAVLLL